MTLYEIAQKAVNERTAQEIKHRGGNQYNCKADMWQGYNRGWTLFDTFTASAVVQIYENLKPENQVKYINLPLPKFIAVTWKIAGSYSFCTSGLSTDGPPHRLISLNK